MVNSLCENDSVNLVTRIGYVTNWITPVQPAEKVFFNPSLPMGAQLVTPAEPASNLITIKNCEIRNDSFSSCFMAALLISLYKLSDPTKQFCFYQSKHVAFILSNSKIKDVNIT